MEPVTSRLKALRARATPKLSVRKMAEALDLPASTYAAYEDPAKYKKPILPLPLAKQIADILVDHAIDRAEVMNLAGLTGELSAAPIVGAEKIFVIGEVQAGVWTERPEWDRDEWYAIDVDPSPMLGAERFALEMVGNSMERIIPSGFTLECLRVFGRDGPQPRDGHIVIVRRTDGDLTETTCKRLEVRPDGEFVLHCASSRPEFSEPIFMGRPDRENFTDDGVRIIGIVYRASQDLLRKRRHSIREWL